MKRKWAAIGVFAVGAGVALAYAQPPPQPSIDERVAALEREVARIGTRTQLHESTASTDPSIALSGRLDQLERTVGRLSSDLQRIERQADNALRNAAAAQRTAEDAQRLARDAALRR
jgi:hypothetical protein